MKLRCASFAFLASLCFADLPAAKAQDLAKSPSVHLIWMGGNDCPPCVAWRKRDFPRLEASDEFKNIQFSYVIKTIESPVPPRFLLPSEVKPYKKKLDEASAGLNGSPQAAVIVNGEIYDYFFGTRSAEKIEEMLRSIRTGTTYPFERCVKLSKERGKCEIKG